MDRTAAAMVLAFIALVGSPARAGQAGRVEPRFFGGAASARDQCQLFVATRLSPLSSANVQLADCLQLIRGALMPPLPDALASIQHDAPGLSIHGARHRQLLSTYRALKQLEPWVNQGESQRGTSPLSAELRALEADALAALDAHGLSGGRYAAILRGEFGRADPGGYADRPPDAPNQGVMFAGAELMMETTHVDIGRRWDAALVFDVGQRPLFAMVKTATTVTPAYIGGLATSTGFRLAHASRSTETAVVAHLGAARLGSLTTTIGSGSQSGSAVVAANDIAEWAFFFDGGVDFRWYARDVWLVHLANDSLDPLVHLYAGAKHDQRFHRAGDLAGFNDPTGRIVFGFNVNAIRVTDRRAEGSGNALFTVGAGFEFEGSIRTTDRLPSGFRVVLSGDLDLVQAFRRLHGSGDRDPRR